MSITIIDLSKLSRPQIYLIDGRHILGGAYLVRQGFPGLYENHDQITCHYHYLPQHLLQQAEDYCNKEKFVLEASEYDLTLALIVHSFASCCEMVSKNAYEVLGQRSSFTAANQLLKMMAIDLIDCYPELMNCFHRTHSVRESIYSFEKQQ